MPRTMWTAEKVLATVATLPIIEDPEEWRRVYVVPIAEFGFQLTRLDERISFPDYEDGTHTPVLVPIEKIIYSTQFEGIRLDAVAWYLKNTKLFDPEGWFGNDVPVLVRHGMHYIACDGNHRIIADLLKGHDLIRAYVQRR